MTQSPATESFACLTCRQRKVKCNRLNPCSNCQRAEQPCNFVAPIRGKRKRTKPPRESLHDKLKRYERLLEFHGVKIEPQDGDDESDQETGSEMEFDQTEAFEHPPPTQSSVKTSIESKSRLLAENGSSRYLERYAELVYSAAR
jgi:Fungal Zn(2)-Cys(6) binuclear cluster domain